MDLVNQLVEERRRIEEEDEERRKEQQEQAAAAAASKKEQRSGGGPSASARSSSSKQPQKPRSGNAVPGRHHASSSSARHQRESSNPNDAASQRSKNSATAKQSLRQSRREQRKEEDAAAVAAASSALLDSIVPPQLVQSASNYILSEAPRIFSFHTRHISSFRHPFFAMLCNETPVDAGGAGHHHHGLDDDTPFAVSTGTDLPPAENDNKTNSKLRRGTTRSSSSAHAPGKPIHRGGTAMVTTAHVSAVDNALKARRKSWQTLGEYLCDRFSDISSGYPIQMERWRQASYMLDAVLLEDDLSRRRRDILEAPVVVRALEACWTSWGGTTTSGIPFDKYREQHLRLYLQLLEVEALDPALSNLVEACIEKDWAVDREMVVPSSPAAGRLFGGGSGSGFLGGNSTPNDGLGASSSRPSFRNKSPPPNSGSIRRASSVRGASEEMGSEEQQQQQQQEQQQQMPQYEVSFRRFCVSMLELADNWTRARVGDVFAQIFSRFLMKVVLCPRSGGNTNNNQHSDSVDRERTEIGPQHAEGGEPQTNVLAVAASAGSSSGMFEDDAAGKVATAAAAAAAAAASHYNNKKDEWSHICQGLKKRAFMHRGGPIIRMVPPACPGIPATYVALHAAGMSGAADDGDEHDSVTGGSDEGNTNNVDEEEDAMQ